MDLLVYEIEKGLARECFKKGQVIPGIEHYEKYIDFIKSQLSIDESNEDLNQRLTAVIKEYNKSLYEEAQKSFNSGKWVKTTELCQKLIKNGTDHHDIYKYLSFCYKNLKQKDIRLDFIKKYVELVPQDEENNKHLGEAYYECDAEKYAMTAIEYLEKHLEKYDKDTNIWNLVGHIYATSVYKNPKQIEKQLNCFLKAYEIDPENMFTLKNIAQTYTRARMAKEATEAYEKLFAKHRDKFTNDDWFSLAAFKLRFGDYKKGWEYYEERFNPHKKGPEDSGVWYPKITQPRWDGIKDIKESTLLVHAEQGLGDNIMFVRFCKNVQKYAKKVIYVTPDLVYPLFWESNLPFDIYPMKHNLKELEFDYHIPIMSLPHVLGIGPENITDRDGYLTINPERKAAYRKAFIEDNDKFKLGINFEGGESGKSQARDIDWVRLKDFAEIENIEIYCLNKNITQEYIKEILPECNNIIALGHSLNNFADTGAAVDNMDYIVSTDSSILNLMGALGKDSVGLFNFDYEYRWYNVESGTVHWYSKIKPIVNETQNDWEKTIALAVEEVKKVIAKKHKK